MIETYRGFRIVPANRGTVRVYEGSDESGNFISPEAAKDWIDRVLVRRGEEAGRAQVRVSG